MKRSWASTLPDPSSMIQSVRRSSFTACGIIRRTAKRDFEEEGPKEEEEEESPKSRGRSPVRLWSRSPLRLCSAARQTAVRAVQRQSSRDRSLSLNHKDRLDLANEAAKEQEIANWKLKSPFQVRKL